MPRSEVSNETLGRESTSKAYAEAIEAINKKMQANRLFLKAKYQAIEPHLKKELKGGVVLEACYSCGFIASRVDEIAELLYEATCRVCSTERKFLQVTCPRCGETIQVDDLGQAQADCPNEDFEVTLDWLLEKFGPDEDPKEESDIAYCSYCEFMEPSAIPFGGDGRYLCLSCLGQHESTDKCEWCGALNASLKEYSYLEGCVGCSGKFGSDSFQRE